MPKKRHKPEEIVAKLRQVDVLVSQGQAVADAIRAILKNRCCPPACRYEIAFLSSCNERAPVPCDCGPVAMILGRVATIMGRTVLASCNQCGPGGAMIAIPSADVCSPLQV